MERTSVSFVEGVQSTAMDALKMKISTVNKKYCDDQFVFEMEPKKNHKNFIPIINRGTWSRLYCIKNTTQKLLSSFKENNPETKVNIISLGSGYDTLYFVLKENFDNFKYFEIDYGEINYKKIELIKKSQLLRNCLLNDENENFNEKVKIKGGNLCGEDYFIIECDVTNYESLNQKLCDIPDFDFSNPTIIIAECLLVYIKKDTTYQMLHNFTTIFKNLIFLEYDLVGANDNFGREMVNNLLNRDIKLYGYEDVPDAFAQSERLYKTGFVNVQVTDMLEYYNKCIDPSDKNKIENLEFVDEYEEWNLLQQHACFGYGTKLEEKFNYINEILILPKIDSIYNQ